MLKVLIAEDDVLIARMTEEVLVESGFAVCGIARTVSEAVALGRLHRPDLALLDMGLADGGLGTEVAAELAAFGRIGVLYATGNTVSVMESAGEGDACIVAEIVATGTASPPFPRGFNVLPRATIADPAS